MGEGIHSHVLGEGVVNLLTIPGEPLVRTACLMEHSAVGCHCVALEEVILCVQLHPLLSGQGDDGLGQHHIHTVVHGVSIGGFVVGEEDRVEGGGVGEEGLGFV